jgi:hypothetical protein
MSGINRVKKLKYLGITHNFDFNKHVSEMICSSAQSLYVPRTLRANGMYDSQLVTVFKTAALAKLLHSSPAWWGFTSVSDRNRLVAFLRKAIRARFYESSSPIFLISVQQLTLSYLNHHKQHQSCVASTFVPPPPSFS